MLKCQQVLREYFNVRGDQQAVVKALSETVAEAARNTVIDSDDGKTRIIFNLTAPTNVESKNSLSLSWITEAPDSITHFVLVIDDELHSKRRLFSENNLLVKFVEKELQKTIEFFDVADLKFNVLLHDLVPKHEVIRDAESKKRITEEHSLRTQMSLPLILNSDPVARAIGARPGDIVKVTRFSKNAGEHVAYRNCIEGLRPLATQS